jgi:hypothetical protein
VGEAGYRGYPRLGGAIEQERLPVSGGDRKALGKEPVKSRAMTRILPSARKRSGAAAKR